MKRAYVYAKSIEGITAGSSGSTTITIKKEIKKFDLQRLIIKTTGAAVINFKSTDINNAYWFDLPVHTDMFKPEAKLLEFVKEIGAGATITIEYTDKSGSTNNIYIAMIGYEEI